MTDLSTISDGYIPKRSGAGWQSFDPLGFQGIQGFQGFVGAQGFQGFEGVQGSQGYQGLEGIQGPQGFQGLEGSQGAQGFQGHQGFQGYQGIQGPQAWLDNPALGGGATATLGTIGGIGPANSAQNSWAKVDIGGNQYYIPLWT